MSATLVVIRHGQTTFNAENRIQGHIDAPLSEMGLAQAQEIAQTWRTHAFDAIYTSDLQRAANTAAPLANLLDMTPIPRRDLREWFLGDYQGLTKEEVKVRFKEGFIRLRKLDPECVVPGGETYRQFHERALGALAAIAQDHQEACVAVFTHGGVMVNLLRAVHNVPMDEPNLYAVGNGQAIRVCYEDGRWHLLT